MATKRFFFQKEQKLTEAKEFRFLFLHAKRYNSFSFCFHVLKNNKTVARLGVVVAKRNQKLATNRNSNKRLVRESFRYNQERVAGLDLIVVAKRGIAQKTKQELQRELDAMWNKISNVYQSRCAVN